MSLANLLLQSPQQFVQYRDSVLLKCTELSFEEFLDFIDYSNQYLNSFQYSRDDFLDYTDPIKELGSNTKIDSTFKSISFIATDSQPVLAPDETPIYYLRF